MGVRGVLGLAMVTLVSVIAILAPVLAPFVGGLLVGPIGWRGTLWTVTGLCLAMLLGVLAVARETRPARVRANDTSSWSASVRAVLRSRPYWGATTVYALSFAVMKGQRAIPAGDKTILDMVPVDMVSASLIAITAQALRKSERRVYQQASGDSNPFYAPRSVELVGLYRRKHFRERETGSALVNDVKSRLEPQPVSKRSFLALLSLAVALISRRQTISIYG